jgi:hypothetical protein
VVGKAEVLRVATATADLGALEGRGFGGHACAGKTEEQGGQEETQDFQGRHGASLADVGRFAAGVRLTYNWSSLLAKWMRQ